VLSLPPPSTFFDDARFAAESSARVNDELVAQAAAFPGRFAVLACLPLPHVDESLRELERIGNHPLVRGVGLVTTLHEWSLDAPQLVPVFELAAARNLPVVLHPAMEAMHWCFNDMGLNASLGTLTSSTVGVVRLVLAGLLERVPELVPIVPHLGGTIPYVAHRVSEMSRGNAQPDLLEYCRTRLYFDNCSFHQEAFRCAVDVAGADRIMLGSDFPGRGALDRCIDLVVESDLSGADQELILGGTASRWFALAAAPSGA
jgi:aminocarboxymuconate-semialdehyde decarboxylase